MTKMLEKMAHQMRARAETMGCDNLETWEYLWVARAGLLALRDLDSGDINSGGLSALVAGKNALFSCTADPELSDARGCFHAMIDEILGATPDPTAS